MILAGNGHVKRASRKPRASGDDPIASAVGAKQNE